MTAAVAIALLVLLVADASLVGYRAVCGRSAFVDRAALDRRAARVGAAAGVVAAVALAGWFGGLLVAADSAGALVDDLTRPGAALLAVYAGFAGVTLLALVGWAVAPKRWGTLAMVTILGPLTLARPLVLVVGVGAAVGAGGDRRVTVAASCAVVLLVVAVETALLGRWGARASASFRPDRAAPTAGAT